MTALLGAVTRGRMLMRSDCSVVYNIKINCRWNSLWQTELLLVVSLWSFYSEVSISMNIKNILLAINTKENKILLR